MVCLIGCIIACIENMHTIKKSYVIYNYGTSRYHQVTSVGSNIAVNIWWKHLHSFIPRQCDNISSGTLDKFHFSSLEKNGDDSAEDDDEPENLM